jgi:hypothetical protein
MVELFRCFLKKSKYLFNFRGAKTGKNHHNLLPACLSANIYSVAVIM